MNADAAARLVELCYEAAMEESRWETFLVAYAAAMKASAANMHSRSVPDEILHYIFSHGLPEEYLQSYGAYFHTRDLWVEPSVRLPSGTVFSADALVERRTYQRSEFYNDFLKPQAVHHVAGLLVSDDEHHRGCVSVFRPAGDEDFGTAEHELARAVYPHLMRAHRIMETLREARGWREHFRDTLQKLNQPVFLLDPPRHVAFMNDAAVALARAGDGLTVRRGCLVATHPAADAGLDAAVASAFAWYADRLRRTGGGMVLPRRAGKPPLQALATPLASSSAATLDRHRVVAVFVSDPSTMPPSLEQRLAATYGLTPAEVRLVRGLVAGAALADVATEAGISAGTARIQLKSAFHKMDVHSQAQLVRLVLASFGPLPDGEARE